MHEKHATKTLTDFLLLFVNAYKLKRRGKKTHFHFVNLLNKKTYIHTHTNSKHRRKKLNFVFLHFVRLLNRGAFATANYRSFIKK